MVKRYRDAGFADSESTVRRELDDAITDGLIRWYRTRGQYRRVRAADVEAYLHAKQLPGTERAAALEELRRRNRGPQPE